MSDYPTSTKYFGRGVDEATKSHISQHSKWDLLPLITQCLGRDIESLDRCNRRDLEELLKALERKAT